MSPSDSKLPLSARRAELLVELYLQDLEPMFVARPAAADFGVDFFVGFRNARGGINLSAVEVKATEKEVEGRFPIQRKLYDLLANSNIPVVLIVADVKRNRLYWGAYDFDESLSRSDAQMLRLPVRALEPGTRGALRERLAH